MEIKQVEVPMNPARVCDAIAKIGYSPWAAIMDIVDNSIASGARNVVIEIITDPDKTHASKDNVTSYRVIDDGTGMSEDQIINAFRLGANATYGPNSLSKYGLGLKSAGFSLGSRIKIVSKQGGSFSPVTYVDKGEIADAGRYVVTSMPPVDEAIEPYEASLDAFESGTVVEITGCQTVQHDSARATRDRLNEKLGVTYYTFLRNEQDPLSITLRCTGKDDISVKPLDILFLDLAEEGFDKDTYDCKTPRRVLQESIHLPGTEGGEPVMIEVVIFPRDAMSNYPNFSKEERKQIESYKVKRANKGFFIYRNNRLIQGGVDLDLVGKDAYGFRGRLVINSHHDEALHVDVSKQQLVIPEDVLKKIEVAIRLPLRDSKDAFTLCTDKLKSLGTEGSGFNYKNQDLVEEDPEEPVGEEKTKAAKKRKEKLVKETEKRDEEEKEQEKDEPGAQDPESAPEPETVPEDLPVFERVRYSDRVASSVAWEAGFDPVEGTFVRINKNHLFYTTVLSKLAEGDRARQSIEALLWACAAAENKTFQNMVEVDGETIEKVIMRFKKTFATNLDTWSGRNQDLFDDIG